MYGICDRSKVCTNAAYSFIGRFNAESAAAGGVMLCRKGFHAEAAYIFHIFTENASELLLCNMSVPEKSAYALFCCIYFSRNIFAQHTETFYVVGMCMGNEDTGNRA